MTTEQYWIGRGIDVEEVWRDFENGGGYKTKFDQMECHLIEIVFDNPNSQPLFNHEAIFKTMKHLFHETKRFHFTDEAYQFFGPLFLYQVRRSSGVYQFLVEFVPGFIFLLSLSMDALDVLNRLEKYKGKKLDNKIKKEILSKMRQNQTSGREQERELLEQMKRKLQLQGIKKVTISIKPFKATDKTKKKIEFKVKK